MPRVYIRYRSGVRAVSLICLILRDGAFYNQLVIALYTNASQVQISFCLNLLGDRLLVLSLLRCNVQRRYAWSILPFASSLACLTFNID